MPSKLLVIVQTQHAHHVGQHLNDEQAYELSRMPPTPPAKDATDNNAAVDKHACGVTVNRTGIHSRQAVRRPVLQCR